MSSGPLSIFIRCSGFLQSPALMVHADNQTTFFHSEREDVASKLKKTALTYAKCSVLIDNSSMNGTLTPHAIHAKTEMK